MPQILTVGSLFSGIGGIDFGLEKTGRFRIAWQVEIDDYCQKVLTKHWPHVARFRDVRTVGRQNLHAIDVLAGGFPCQDISSAGRRAGITGERSGLWTQFYRLICELRPRYVLVENVAALLYPIKHKDGTIEPAPISRVLGDLARSRYDAEWQVLSAQAFGAPHLRERIFLVAYSSSSRQQECQDSERVYHQLNSPSDVSYSVSHRCPRWQQQPQPWQLDCSPITGQDGDREPMADTTRNGRHRNTQFQGRWEQVQRGWDIWPNIDGCGPSLAHPDRQSLAVGQVFGGNAAAQLTTTQRSCSNGSGMWSVEPDVGRVADGVSRRVDRLRGLGNAVVPQAAEYVGFCIAAHYDHQPFS